MSPEDVLDVLRRPRDLFAPVEFETIVRLESRAVRRDHVAGRVAAKRLAGKLLASRGLRLSLAQIVVRNEVSGAPRLVVEDLPAIGGAWALSISHAKGWAACAMLPLLHGRVGVDLEVRREVEPALLRHLLSPRERRRLERDRAGTAPSAVELWAVKEAIFKARQCGIDGSPRGLEVAWRRLRRGGPGRRPGSAQLAVRTIGPRERLAYGVVEDRGPLILAWAVQRTTRPRAISVPGHSRGPAAGVHVSRPR